jgi:hypothetical protein
MLYPPHDLRGVFAQERVEHLKRGHDPAGCNSVETGRHIRGRGLALARPAVAVPNAVAQNRATAQAADRPFAGA